MIQTKRLMVKSPLRLLLTSVLLLLPGLPAAAQTSADLEKKYGAPVTFYEVRPGLLLSAKYSNSGQVCKMVIERMRKTESGVTLESTLTDELAKELIGELVPAPGRGEKDKFYGLTLLFRGEVTSYAYENVSIALRGKAVLVIEWKYRPCKQN
jgi:hypothetical protein